MDLYEHDFINIDGNIVHKTAIIHPNVIIGKGNIIGAYSVIGGNGEIRGVNWKNFEGKVIIGNNNVISELVTIQRPFEQANTIIGDGNIIMAHAHIGHDAIIGNNCEICTGTVIGGYSQIQDNVKLKVNVSIRNRIIVCQNSIVGMGSVVTKTVEANKIVYGNPAKEKR
jgi:UDP-N-acetylglucosamine acyltransferase